MHEHELSGRPVQDRRGVERRRSPRRARGPWPVRPGRPAVAVRPAEPQRPWVPRPGRRAQPLGPRLLVRRRAAAALGLRVQVCRVVAGLTVTVAAATVVVGLGLLAGAVVATRGGGEDVPAAPIVTVTVQGEATVWDVARRVAPRSAGGEIAALAERIVTDNALTSVQLHPGQVLRVSSG